MELASLGYDNFSQGMHDGDEKLLVKFFLKPRENTAKSLEVGHPVYEDVEWVSICAPGSREPVVRVAHDGDRNRFPNHYQAFKQRMEAPSEGMPLEEWPAISRSQVEQLKFMNVKTVEQLAALADQHTQGMMGLGNLKRTAIAYLQAAKADAPLREMTTQLEQRDNQIAALTNQVSELSLQLTQLLAAQSSGTSAPVQAPASSPLPAPASPEELFADVAPKEFRSVLAEPEQPVKRGPGRPRKNPPPEA